MISSRFKNNDVKIVKQEQNQVKLKNEAALLFIHYTAVKYFTFFKEKGGK